MPTAIHFLAVLVAATKTTKPSTASTAVSYFFLLALVMVLFLFFRSRSGAARRQRNTLMDITVGDEVLTAAGIFGTVLDVEPDRVTLETAPGTRITVVRSTIARRMSEPQANSVAEQNWHDEGHDGVAEAASWHDPSEHDDASGPDATGTGAIGPGANGNGAGDDPEPAKDKPEADGAPGTTQGGGR
jgi:preprotein translocase subunit YajC